MPSFWTCVHVLLDNLCIILIDLSTAALTHLNRLLADRPLNLLLNAILHTWLLLGRQIPDDPIINTFDMASAEGMGILKACSCGKQCASPAPPTHNGLRIDTQALVTTRAPTHAEESWCLSLGHKERSLASSSHFLPVSAWGCLTHPQSRAGG